ADLDLERRHGRRIAVADGARPTISTHVLDTGTGMPAAVMLLTLSRLNSGAARIGMTERRTDGDGRIRDLLERPLVAGDYRLEFDLARDEAPFFTRFPTCVHSAATA